MFAALVVVAGLVAAADPAPLPDRWLLKLVPDDLPSLPDPFHTTTWYYGTDLFTRVGPSWEFWAEFHKAGEGRPAEAVLTLTGGEQGRFNGPFGLDHLPTTRGHRIVPLAVHGPLVEFEGRLYTATFRTSKAVPGRRPEREMLHLGSAVELKDRVWYQAGTTTPSGGGMVSVEEWRIEFRDDPRTKDRGTATLRGHWRVLIDPGGKSFESEVSFLAGNTYEKGRIVTLNWPTGMKQTRLLPSLEIAGPRGGANDMRVDNMHRLSLHAADKPRPKVVEKPAGLVQPPAKKPG